MGEAKTHLSSLIEEAQRGVEVILAKNGKPVARISPVETPTERPMGFIKLQDTEAFVRALLEPLPDEELKHWTGEA
ncbi:MAG: type II toxin-antitoxin system prevent-host-death family antitoxin [Pleurocapsa sp. SU_196_0]|nr:type II toxin-antitoxin system prevent-host-death family antitoxin [Pleurocapsa sp. SU_196_0]